MRYPGGKGKCYQHIINLMPPHRVFIETHLGGGAVLRHKKPAQRNIAIELDERVLERWRETEARSDVELVRGRAEDFLMRFPFSGDELVYCDPPYHPATRRRSRVYACDYSETDHEQLLATLTTLPCMVILSGYSNSLYEQRLAGWRVSQFFAKTHTCVRTETLWFNFDPPTQLHDDRYIGPTFREREKAKRRIQRLQEKFRRMRPIERAAIARWLNETYPSVRGDNPCDGVLVAECPAVVTDPARK